MSTVTEELKALQDDLKSAWEDFKAEHTAALEESKKETGELRAEAQQTLDRINARVDEHVDEINVRLKKLQLESSRGDGPAGPSEARKAYEAILRQGVRGVRGQEGGPDMLQLLAWTDGSDNPLGPQAAMTISDDTTGGFLAPEDVVDTIIKGVVEYSPIRDIAFVRTTTRNSVKAPKRTQTAGAVWAGEVDTRSETQNPKFGKEELSTRELSAMADISRQDLEDAGVDLEALIYGEFSEQFGVSEGAAFVSGDGVDGKPEGFLTAADTGYLGSNGIETVNGATNDVIGADDLINVYFALKDVYARNATWVWKRSTTAAVRKLKETSTDNYLWQPGLATLSPPTVLGQPYVEAIDMPAVADGALCVAFGDWNRGYWIIDRLQIETLRDPYTQAGNGYIRFWARKRVGGQVVLPEALKLLQII